MPGNRVFLQVALNGASRHPRTPKTPEEVAADTRAAVAAGAQSVHFHPFDARGRETLDPEDCARAIRAVRAACPGVAISLSTSAAIEADPARRLALISGWTELPDLVTANQGEAGIREVCELLVARGVGIEAGLLSAPDARAFLASGLAPLCHRVMVEPLDPDPEAALRHAEEIEATVTGAGIVLQQVHHGEGVACWSVNRRALGRGHGIRTGLEDVTVLPDGRPAAGNAELAAAAMALIDEAEGPGA